MLRYTNTRAAAVFLALLLMLLQTAVLAVPPATPPAAPADAVAADIADDRAIARRLHARLGAIGGLKDVKATVVEGVVILEGGAQRRPAQARGSHRRTDAGRQQGREPPHPEFAIA